MESLSEKVSISLINSMLNLLFVYTCIDKLLQTSATPPVAKQELQGIDRCLRSPVLEQILNKITAV